LVGRVALQLRRCGYPEVRVEMTFGFKGKISLYGRQNKHVGARLLASSRLRNGSRNVIALEAVNQAI
jgi:hypothetical protein